MKAYNGRRAADGSAIVTRADGSEVPLRLDLYNHSPTGFEWGYSGSGPAQLALARAPLEVVIRIPPEAILRWPRRGPFGERE